MRHERICFNGAHGTLGNRFHAVTPFERNDAVPQLGAVGYAFVILVGVVAFGLVLVARARRRDRRDRDELRKHIRRFGGPFDSAT